jgi:hypothetical protein
VAVPREISNQIPANKLKIENKTEIVLALVNRFAISKLIPITISADGMKTVPKFNISNCVNTNNIVPVRKITELKTIPT